MCSEAARCLTADLGWEATMRGLKLRSFPLAGGAEVDFAEEPTDHFDDNNDADRPSGDEF